MTNSAESIIYEFDCFRVDDGKRLLYDSAGSPIPLTPKVFDTLLYLVSHTGKIITKDELISAIWTDAFVEENNLNKNISTLRRVLGENPGEHRFIVTVPGKGYKFVANVRQTTSGNIPEISDAVLANEKKEFGKGGFRYIYAITAASILFTAIVAGSFYWPKRGTSTEDVSPRTIAILPFRSLVAENRDEALELGMADTLISRLGNNREIIVRPLSSVRNFGLPEQDAAEAGRALAVESVLDGNIQRWGDRIRVNVRLIKVTDGKLLWSDTFDEKFNDIFVVQDSIANRVTTALAFQLTGKEKTRLGVRSTNSPEAYAFYLRGRYHVFKITETDIRKGIGFYEQAIRLDPNYALAYAEMGDAYRVLVSAAFEPSDDVCRQAKAMSVKALQLDDSLAEPHIVLGWVGFLCDWDWDAAERELVRAIEISPNNSEAHRAYAHLLSNAGRHDEAIAEGKLARELAPLTLITATLESQFLFFAGRDAEAVERLNQTLELDPTFWVAHNLLGRIYTRQGRYADAIAELQTALKQSGSSNEVLMQLGYALAKSGDHEGALATIRELKSSAKDKYVPAYNLAMIYNGLGATEEALNLLAQSFEQREKTLVFIKVDTRWDNLRSEPRFIEQIKQINFPQ